MHKSWNYPFGEMDDKLIDKTLLCAIDEQLGNQADGYALRTKMPKVLLSVKCKTWGLDSVQN